MIRIGSVGSWNLGRTKFRGSRPEWLQQEGEIGRVQQRQLQPSSTPHTSRNTPEASVQVVTLISSQPEFRQLQPRAPLWHLTEREPQSPNIQALGSVHSSWHHGIALGCPLAALHPLSAQDWSCSLSSLRAQWRAKFKEGKKPVVTFFKNRHNFVSEQYLPLFQNEYSPVGCILA